MSNAVAPNARLDHLRERFDDLLGEVAELLEEIREEKIALLLQEFGEEIASPPEDFWINTGSAS